MSNRHHPSWSEVRDKFLAEIKDVVPAHASCAVCRWYVGLYDDGAIGECRRHVPDVSKKWPVVRETLVCGDWQSDYNPVPRT
jgi:hypothetical protein